MRFHELEELCESNWKSKIAAGMLAGASLLSPNVDAGNDKQSETVQTVKKFTPDTVTRIIFAEAGGSGPSGKRVSDEERRLVASSIYNRIGNKAFGNHKTATEVVKAPKQYSALNSTDNTLWKLSADTSKIPTNLKRSWIMSAKLANDIASGTGDFDNDVVIYHDRSIKKPTSWSNNPYWNYVAVKTTPNFIFYKIVKK